MKKTILSLVLIVSLITASTCTAFARIDVDRYYVKMAGEGQEEQ